MTAGVVVTANGLLLGDREVPLFSGEAHYWRLRRGDWPNILGAIAALGFAAVSTYLPWSKHENPDGSYCFDGDLDVEEFLRTAAEHGLLAVVRVGPNCGAELEDAGWSHRVLEDPDCQARRPGGGRYLLPTATGHAFMPSYASTKTLAMIGGWYDEIVGRLAPLQWPAGPIVAAQVDNEMGFHFQSHPYALDYHPDAITQWHEFLSEKYDGVANLNAAYSSSYSGIQEVVAPGDGRDQPEARRVDWVTFREHHLRRSLTTLAGMVRDRGFDRIPLLHNDFPRVTTPLDQGALEASGAVDVAGGDIYAPKEGGRYVRDFARHLETSTKLGYLAEMGVGWLTLPWLLPMRVTPTDVEHNLWRALSGGVRASNVFMLVERDRWYASPLSATGERREELAGLFQRLLAVLADLEWTTLRRNAKVLLVANRDEERIVSAGSLLGDVVPAFSQLLPLDRRLFDAPDERGATIDGWSRAVTSALDELGVDCDRAASSALPDLDGYDLILLPHVDVIDPAVLGRLAASGATFVTGPVALPGSRPLVTPGAGVLEPLVTAPVWHCDDSEIDVTVFSSATREVLIVISGAKERKSVTLCGPPAFTLLGRWREEKLWAADGTVNVELPAWGAQVFEVSR